MKILSENLCAMINPMKLIDNSAAKLYPVN